MNDFMTLRTRRPANDEASMSSADSAVRAHSGSIHLWWLWAVVTDILRLVRLGH
jgi:hypothetical protein